jgi:hypothetical protein
MGDDQKPFGDYSFNLLAMQRYMEEPASQPFHRDWMEVLRLIERLQHMAYSSDSASTAYIAGWNAALDHIKDVACQKRRKEPKV